MLYCERCRRLTTEAVCPVCNNLRLRLPEAEDECFLAEKAMLWKEAVADLLHSEEIPFICRPAMGAGLTMSVGYGLERYRFYVPYARLEEAQTLVEEFFTPTNEQE